MKGHQEDPQPDPLVTGPTDNKLPALTTLAPTLVPAQAAGTEPDPLPEDRAAPETRTLPLPENLKDQERRGASVPGYEILSELGRGGMGVVYKARHLGLDRVVALKMILAGLHAGTEQRDRFHSEAQSIARLRHPHIVQVYEVGENDGRPFFSLEYCPGGSLADRLAGTPMPPRPAAALVEQLARAMQVAHDYHLIHRDLKPANVLLAEDGSPRVTDFGLAKRLDEASYTQSGALMGTPSYMAPEQAAGKTHDLGPAVDIYALGAILYECLTGRPPFRAASVMETVRQVQSDEPVPPTQLQPRIDRDLETICLKCLQKEPPRRYETAVALAEDLRRFQAGETIRARPVSQLDRAVKWTRRRPTAAALIAVSVLAALAFLAGGVYFTDRLRTQRNEALELEAQARKEKARAVQGEEDAKRERRRADAQLLAAQAADRRTRAQLDRARRNLFTAQMVRVAGLLDTEPPRALALLQDFDACPLDLRDFVWGCYSRLAQRNRATLAGHADEVRAVALSWDGKTAFSAGSDRVIKIWDTAAKKELPGLRGHTGSVTALSLSPDGRWLASGSEDGTVRLWPRKEDRRPVTLTHSGRVTTIAFSLDGKALVSGCDNGVLTRWAVPTGEKQEFRDTSGKMGGIRSVALSPDGKTLASSDSQFIDNKSGYLVRLWDLDRREVRARLTGHRSPVRRVAFSPDGTSLVSAAAGVIKVWNVAEAKERGGWSIKDNREVMDLVFSPDGNSVAVAESSSAYPDEREIALWDLATRRVALVLGGHPLDVTSIAFSGDGKMLVSGSADRTVKLWAVRPDPELAVLRGHTGPIADADLSADGDLLVTADAAMIRLWDPGTGRERKKFADLEDRVRCVRLSPDGRTLIFGGKSPEGVGVVRLWSITEESKRVTLTVGKGLQKERGVKAVAVSPDGRTVAGGIEDGRIILWDVPSQTIRRTLAGHPKPPIHALCFSPDGKTLLSSGEDKTLLLWDAVGTDGPVILKGHSSWVMTAAYSRDGRMFATGNYDNRIQLWDVATRQVRATLTEPGRPRTPVSSVGFSPDGATLVSGSDDGAVHVWDTATGQLRAAFKGHAGSVPRVLFHPDGKRAFTVGTDALVKIWGGDPGLPRASWKLRSVQGLCFTPGDETLIVGDTAWDNPGHGQVAILDAITGQRRPPLRGPNSEIRCVALSPDGTTLATGGGPSADGELRLWDLASLKPSIPPAGHTSSITALAFSPDNKTLATGSADRTIQLRQGKSGLQDRVLAGHAASVTFLAFSPDGTMLASGSEDRTIRLWEVSTGKLIVILKGHTVPVYAGAFSPDGRSLASGGGESDKPGELKLWGVATHQEKPLPHAGGQIYAVAFSFDGKTLASGGATVSGAGELKLRDAASGNVVASFSGHTRSVRAVAFTRNGKALASGDDGGLVCLWGVKE